MSSIPAKCPCHRRAPPDFKSTSTLPKFTNSKYHSVTTWYGSPIHFAQSSFTWTDISYLQNQFHLKFWNFVLLNPFSLYEIFRTYHYKSFATLNLCKPSTPLKGNWAMAKKLTQIVPKKILPKRNCLSPQNILQPATQQQWKSCLGKIFSWGRQIIQSPLWETVPEIGKKLRDGSIWWECMKYLEAVSPSMRYTQSSCKTAQTCGRTIKPIIKNSSFVK